MKQKNYATTNPSSPTIINPSAPPSPNQSDNTPTPTFSPVASLTPTPKPESIPKLATPTFTVTITNYTGKDNNAYSFYTIHDNDDTRVVTVTINNQPFTPFMSSTGADFNLYYNIRVKGQYTNPDSWINLCGGDSYLYSTNSFNPHSADTSTTILSVQGPTVNAHLDYNDVEGFWFNWNSRELFFSTGSVISFQVQAMIGSGNRPVGETSDWSQTQTIVIS